MTPREELLLRIAHEQGFLSPARLAEAQRLEEQLRGQGRSPGLLPLLAQHYLSPAQVEQLRRLPAAPPPAHRDAALDTTHAGPGEAPRLLDVIPRESTWAPGQRLGDWILEEELGRGGMGVVYAARHVGGGERCALKTLSRRASPQDLQRFRREAQAQRELSGHAHVLAVRDAGIAEGCCYLVMELAPGGDLKERLRAGPLPWRAGVELVGRLARALEHVHARGLLHRDIKPANVLFSAEGAPKLSDFGLVRVLEAESLTATGGMVGTPTYMAPEQARGRKHELDARVDVYGLGALLYHVVTGRPPFGGGSINAILRQVLSEDPAPPSSLAPGLPPGVDGVILRALAKDPGQRYPDARELAEDLERLLAGERVLADLPRRARRPRGLLLPGLGLLGLGILAGAGAVFLRDAEEAAPDHEPPRLELRSAPRSTTRASVRLSGTVQDAAPWVELELSGAPPRRLTSGEPFAFELPLEFGTNRWTLRARDPAGNAAEPTVLEVERRTGVAWFDALGERAPPLPLPAGLRIGAGRGEYVHEADGSLLVWVPPGDFPMGGDAGLISVQTEAEAAAPPRQVRLTRGFFIGKYELDWGRYLRFCTASGRPPPDRHLNVKIELGGKLSENRWLYGGGEDLLASDQHPVWRVSWEDAQAYCAWAGLRLPSEAEWEYAARGNDHRAYPWGNALPASDQLNWLNLDDGHDYPCPGGTFPEDRSPFGCYDMAGNLGEFCADWLGPYPEGVLLVNPEGPVTGRRRVWRGGHWGMSLPYAFRAFSRNSEPPGSHSFLLGFRVCRSHQP